MFRHQSISVMNLALPERRFASSGLPVAFSNCLQSVIIFFAMCLF